VVEQLAVHRWSISSRLPVAEELAVYRWLRSEPLGERLETTAPGTPGRTYAASHRSPAGGGLLFSNTVVAVVFGCVTPHRC
jgi:hypothetical protein